jgi:ComF family protein
MNWIILSTKKINQVYNDVFLTQCYLCNEKSKNTICQHCKEGLSKNTNSCTHCKRPTHTYGFLCGQCQSSRPSYQYCVAPYRFEGIIKNLIHSIKFNQGNHYIRPLMYLLSEQLVQEYSSKPWPEQIVYVPSHPNRIKERGFCQTQVMSKHLVNHLQQHKQVDCPLLIHPNPIKKLKNTLAQHSLSRKERLKNPKNNYQLDSPAAKHIALFDDVMTTGSTIENCTKLLFKAGVEQVDIWVIARTPDKTY